MSVTNTEFREFFKVYMEECRDWLQLINLSEVESTVDILWQAYTQKKRIYLAGNGGSAATAIHFACCLTGGTMAAGKPPMRAEALVSNISSLTALANDFSYELIFTRQLQNCLDPGDVLIAISCSGNSPNVVSAAEYARNIGAYVIGLLGFSGGALHALCHQSVYINNYNYGHVETAHVMVAHLVSQFLKQRILET